MGERELQEALRNRAQERIHAAWQAAEAAVAAQRAEAEAQSATLCAAMEKQSASAAAAERRTLLTATELAMRRQRLAAMTALEERLHTLAIHLLGSLGGDERCRLWRTLAGELPAAEWQRVSVHPDDRVLARQTFPAALVVDDAALVGGLMAAMADGRIEVDNSLPGRLARAWPGLLSPLLAAINEEVAKSAAGPAPAG
jgi:vacuolar-type H+-ATPase subunit E/Vma4